MDLSSNVNWWRVSVLDSVLGIGRRRRKEKGRRWFAGVNLERSILLELCNTLSETLQHGRLCGWS